MTYFQQGDVLARQTQIPADIPLEEASTALKLSQVTGHAHRAVGAVKAYRSGDKTYLRAVEPFELQHEEHKTLTLPAGEYEIADVQEYDHASEEARAVQD